MSQIKAAQFGTAISFLALLAACATPTQTTLSDGTVAYRIDCDVTDRGLNYCFERAGKSCGAAGYTVVDQEGRVIVKSDAGDPDNAAVVRAYDTGQNTRSILVRGGT